MSIMTVPADVYRNILATTYARYVDKGYSNAVAMQKARDLMDGAFNCDDVLQEETSWDHHNPEANRWWP